MDAVQRVKEMVSVAKKEKNWCVVIAIDIRNAFNTAPWPGIIEASSRLGIPPYLLNVFIDYLNDREIVIDDTSLFMSKGVPQGSVLGPEMWNLFYDQILGIETWEGVDLVAYADDLAVIIRHKDRDVVGSYADSILSLITLKLKHMGLEVAAEKTESVVLFCPHRSPDISLSWEGHNIPCKVTIKYLGVWLDNGLRMI